MVEPLRKYDSEYTYEDLVQSTDDARWELIDGVPFDMSPAPTRRHQEISRALFRQFDSFLQNAPCQMYYAPFDVRLPKDGEDAASATTVVEPDLVLICDSQQLDERGSVGPPRLIVEILSPSTITKDLREKLHAYEHAGVAEYWVVWPDERYIMVFTLNEQQSYGTPTLYTSEDKGAVTVVPGLVINLREVFV